MSFLQKVIAVWRKVSLIQRALLTAVALTFAIVSVLVVYWSRRPEMRLLYQDLSPEEASKITEKISEKGIPYQLRSGGTAIYVPKEKVYQLRLDMAREGLPSGKQSGYKLFDDEKIGTSPFVQNINLKRALQDELAMSIQMIDGVERARVHIVTPEQTLFTSEAGKTSASVVLRLRPGYHLSAANVAAITHLVAGSVEQLKPENVTVIDSQGRLLSGSSDQGLTPGAETVHDYRQRVEQSLADKVEDMLTAVLGPGRAAVRVSAVIDMNSLNIVKETYDPTGKVPTKEEIKSGSETKPAAAPAEGQTAVPVGTKKDETTVTEYAVGKIVEQRVDLPGEIKSLAVAAFVDLSPPDANETEGAGQNQMIMPLSDVEEIIRNALGLKETDSLKVVNTRFYRPAEPLMDQQQPNWFRYIAIARQASLGIMAICALLVLKIFSGARKKVETEQKPATSEGGAALLPGGVEETEPLVLRRQIASALRSNPEQVRQLFYRWLTEKQD